MNNNDNKQLEDIYMSIIEENRVLLSEMIVVGDDSQKYNIIAYKDRIWKINERPGFSLQQVKDEIFKIFDYKIEISDTFIQVIVGISGDGDNHEILFATFDNGTLTVMDKYYHMIKSPKNSVLFKKTIETLIAHKVLFSSNNLKDIDKTGFPSKFDTDEIFFHGTSSVYLKDIMGKGLDRNSVNSNYSQVIKDKIKGKTFITSNFRYAFSHAVLNSNRVGGFPLVVSFRIRFEDLLKPDYDVERIQPDTNKALKISREMGIYGYSGNIMPYDFDKLYYSLDHKQRADDYNKSNINFIDASMARDLVMVKHMELEELIPYGN